MWQPFLAKAHLKEDSQNSPGEVMEKKFAVQITNAANTREGLAVTFSDGTTTLFDSDFLYSVRLQARNQQITEEFDEAPDAS
jgi:hypothetical protein